MYVYVFLCVCVRVQFDVCTNKDIIETMHTLNENMNYVTSLCWRN